MPPCRHKRILLVAVCLRARSMLLCSPRALTDFSTFSPEEPLLPLTSPVCRARFAPIPCRDDTRQEKSPERFERAREGPVAVACSRPVLPRFARAPPPLRRPRGGSRDDEPHARGHPSRAAG